MMFCQIIFFHLNPFQFVTYLAVRRCAELPWNVSKTPLILSEESWHQHAARHNLYRSIFMLNINCDTEHVPPRLPVRNAVLVLPMQNKLVWKRHVLSVFAAWQHVGLRRSTITYLASLIFLDEPTVSFITGSTDEGMSNLASGLMRHAESHNQSNGFNNTDPSTPWLAWNKVEHRRASATHLMRLGQERLPKEVLGMSYGRISGCSLLLNVLKERMDRLQ